MTFRTDRNRNPCAFTTDIAIQAGLVLGTDYERGEEFDVNGKTFFTAHLLADPVETSILVIDRLGYYTKAGGQRWTYIAIPAFLWEQLSPQAKRDVIGFHYLNEGGVEMRKLFPNYGKR